MERAWAQILDSTGHVRAAADLHWGGVVLLQRGYTGPPERREMTLV